MKNKIRGNVVSGVTGRGGYICRDGCSYFWINWVLMYNSKRWKNQNTVVMYTVKGVMVTNMPGSGFQLLKINMLKGRGDVLSGCAHVSD